MTIRAFVPLVAASVTALVLAGCGSDDEAGSSTSEAPGAISVVASTNVYGDIAQLIGGDGVEVTSLITSSAQDPHSFEASAQDQLAVSEADVVIENGGGYDPFVDTLLEASGGDAVVLVASELSGLAPGETGDEHAEEGDSHEGEAEEEDGHEGHEGHIEGFNEHVWYSFHGMEAVAEEIAHELGAVDPANEETYVANYEAFAEQVGALEAQADELKSEFDGAGVAITEPVPVYLLEAAGLVNQTPDEFSEAIEEGTDISPTVLQETLALFSAGTVELLAYNDQTSSPETEQVRAAAETAGIPVVNFTETLPDGEDYLGWMTANLDAVSEALSQ